MGLALKVFRFVLFYASWLGSVYSVHYPNPEIISFLCFLPLLVSFLYGAKNRLQVLKMMGLISVAGLCLDSILHAFGYFEYPTESWFPWPVVPLWYFPLWMGFACSMIDMAELFRGRVWLAGALGTVGGPLSFIAGEKLGAITIHGPIWVLSLIWIVVMYLMVAFILRAEP